MHKEIINTRDEPTPASELFPLVYDELRNLAAAKFVHGSSRQTLQATALVHEAYLRMVSKKIPSFQNSRHFFAAAAETSDPYRIPERMLTAPSEVAVLRVN